MHMLTGQDRHGDLFWWNLVEEVSLGIAIVFFVPFLAHFWGPILTTLDESQVSLIQLGKQDTAPIRQDPKRAVKHFLEDFKRGCLQPEDDGM